MQEVERLLASKVDRVEFSQIIQSKANLADLKTLLRSDSYPPENNNSTHLSSPLTGPNRSQTFFTAQETTNNPLKNQPGEKQENCCNLCGLEKKGQLRRTCPPASQTLKELMVKCSGENSQVENQNT